MSSEPKNPKPAPGSAAGDSTPSTRIPRLTDKGRPRTSSSQAKSGKPANKTANKPLTASDFSRTTGKSPASTAVIPAVKADEPNGSGSSTSTIPAASTTTTKTKSATFTSDDKQTETPAVVSSAGKGRAATLRLSHVDPWSVTRMAFAISVALMIVGVVATAIFWLVLAITGVWDQLSGSVTSVLSDDANAFDITDYLGFGRLVGLSLVLSAINVVVMTALATIAAHLYNLAAHVLGGFEVTFNSDK